MFLLILRTTIIYLLIIVAMRLMGKRQLGELQPSELVSTILISNLASISIESADLPLLGSVLPVFMIVSIEILLSALSVRSQKTERLVSGSPKVVIHNGKIDQRMLYELRYTVSDLLEALRGKDIFEIDEVAFAVIETTGKMSVMKKHAYENPTNQDMKIAAPKSTQPSMPMIIDGMLCPMNMKLYDIDEAFVTLQCRRENCEPRDVLLFLCNEIKEVNIIKRLRPLPEKGAAV